MFKFLKLKENNPRRVSIDFGTSFIKAAYLEAGSDKPGLLAYALSPLDASQKTVQEISLLLKPLLEANAITEKEVSLSISEADWIFIKKISLPQMPKDELLNAVKWQLKGQFPFSPEESVSDLQIIREYVDSEAAKKVELLCIFAKKEIINKYVSVAVACGLSVISVSSSEFNYCGILKLILANPEVSAILDIGYTHSQVSIYQKNKLTFARNLNFSVGKLTTLLTGVIVTEHGKLSLNMQKAKEVLAEFGVPLGDGQVLSGDIKASQIISLIRPLLETLAKELNRSFEYFKSESGLNIPEVLYITGGGANLKNFKNYLMEALKMKVEELPLAKLLETKNVDKVKLDLDANHLASVIGLSLSSEGINLLPREIKNLKVEIIQKSFLRVAAISISAVFVFSWFVIHFQITDYKKRLKIAKLHLQSVQEIESLKQLVQARENLINTIYLGKVPCGGLLKLISAIIPPNIILDEFSFDQSSHTLRLEGQVTLGRDSAEKALTDFMQDMENSKFIDEADLISSKELLGVNNFQIKCSLAK